MKGLSSMSEAERAEATREMRAELARNRTTTGFYIQMALAAAAAVTIVVNCAWSILWALLAYVGMSVLLILKPIVWAWSERRLMEDAVEGRLGRAVLWDYVAHFFNWLVVFLCFAAVSFAVFFCAEGYDLSRPLLWICIGGMYVIPHLFRLENPRDYWGHYLCFIQWTHLVTVVASAFAPVGPWLGVAAQIAAACVAIPLGCRRMKQGIVDKVDRYARAAKTAQAMHLDPKSIQSEQRLSELVSATWAEVRVRWMPFAVSLLALVSGVVWTLVQGKPVALLLALAAVLLGYLQSYATDCPSGCRPEELLRRGLDKDLVCGSVEFRALALTVSFVVASTAILWLGGRDLSALVALSLLAVGSCTIAHFVSFKESDDVGDQLVLVVYVAAFSSVVALRAVGCVWWECLLPLPTIGYALPVFRYFFPRSGIRGEARRAAIAAAKAFAADPRSDADRARDEKREKRRLREERRLARLRRSKSPGPDRR